MSTRELPNSSRLDFPVATDLDMVVAFPEAGRVLMTATTEERHLNPHGSVHGAAVFALVDTSMGAATVSVLDEGLRCASIEVQLRFLKAVHPGPLRAETAVVHQGKRVVQLESKVYDGDDALVATAAGSFAVIPPKS